MTIGDIKNRLMPILNDAEYSEKLLGEQDNQFNRRIYVRSIFSYIEGAIWNLKQVILLAPTKDGVKKSVKVSDYAMLSDESYELKNNGESTNQIKYLRLPDNFKFTFMCIKKYMQIELDINNDKTIWNDFLESYRVRNRITHPKNEHEFAITDIEIEKMKRVTSWFNDLVYTYFNKIVESNKART